MSDRKPIVFRLDEPRAVELITHVPADEDAYALEAVAAIADKPASDRLKTRFTWGGLFWSSFSSLVSLGIGLWAWNLIENLFRTVPALGVIGLALAGLCLLALLVIGIREFLSLRQLGKVAELREEARMAFERDDTAKARKAVRHLQSLTRAAPHTASAHAELDEALGDIIDGADLLKVAERIVVAPQDALAKAAIASAAKRVSMVTAISPRAIVDVVFVLAQSVRLVRRIAEAYGGRPSFLGALKLGRAVLGHLTVTGGIAIGDSLVSQVLGAGLAARLSAKLGEGVLNGVLTARVGLAAIAVCRPLPFLGETPPALGDVAGSLFTDKGGKSAKTAE